MTKKQSRKLAGRIRSVKKSLRAYESRYYDRSKDTWTLSEYWAKERAQAQRRLDEMERVYKEHSCGMRGYYRDNE